MNSCIAPLAIRLAPRSLWLPFEMLPEADIIARAAA